MGYSTTFKIKGEMLAEPFLPLYKTYNADVSKYEAVLVGICLTSPCNTISVNSMSILYDIINNAVKEYVFFVRNTWKTDINERFECEDEYSNKHELRFCGWNLSPKGECSWKNEEEIIEYFTRNLFMITIHNTNGRFDKDNGTFLIKQEKIEETVGEIADIINDYMDRKFVEYYRSHPMLADEEGDE